MEWGIVLIGVVFFVVAIYILLRREPPVIVTPINLPCDVFELSEVPESYRDAIEQGCFKVGGEKKVRYRHTASGNYYAGNWHDTTGEAINELRSNIMENGIRFIVGRFETEVSSKIDRACYGSNMPITICLHEMNHAWKRCIEENLRDPSFYSYLHDLDCAHNMSDDELVAYHVKNMKGKKE